MFKNIDGAYYYSLTNCVLLPFSYIVTGDVKGNIKFYDRTLSILNWFSNFKLSSIRTLSFSKTPATPPTEKSNYPSDCTLKGDVFVVRYVVVREPRRLNGQRGSAWSVHLVPGMGSEGTGHPGQSRTWLVDGSLWLIMIPTHF